MNNQESFDNLKGIDLDQCDISLAIVKESSKKRISKKTTSGVFNFMEESLPKYTSYYQYSVVYVSINEAIQEKLRDFISRHIEDTNTVEEYTVDCPEPEGDEVRSISSSETNFSIIHKKLIHLDAEYNAVSDVDELVRANAYIIIVRMAGKIKAIGFRRLPENWKMKKEKGLIPVLYKNNRFEALDTDPVFSIANTIDFIFYDEKLFIFSKKAFEIGLKFREGLIQKAELFYEDAEKEDVFVNLEVLKEKVGNNLRYLRKIANIQDLGYYKDKQFLENMRALSEKNNWKIYFEGRKIVITETNLEDVLSVLQDKRLHSELTEQYFDVDSVRPLDKKMGTNLFTANKTIANKEG